MAHHDKQNGGLGPSRPIGEKAKEQFLATYKDFYIPEEKLVFKGSLGSGTYAEVFHCALQDGEELRSVAVKKMRPDLYNSETDVLDFFRETRLLASAVESNNPHILKFIGVTFSAISPNSVESMCIIEEYMNQGTLEQLIKDTKEGRRHMTEKCSSDRGMMLSKRVHFHRAFLELMVHVASGLSFLHMSDVSAIHRDIKPSNVLVDKHPETGRLTAKLADFGLSTLVVNRNARNNSGQRFQGIEIGTSPENNGRPEIVRTQSILKEWGERFLVARRASRLPGRGSVVASAATRTSMPPLFSLTGQTGSAAYMAPEVFRNQGYNSKADVFSFGVLAFEALNLDHPYAQYYIETRMYHRMENATDQERLDDYADAVSKQGYRAKFTWRWPDELSSLIAECWSHNPQDRPDMRIVVENLQKFYDNSSGEEVFFRPKWTFCGCLSLPPS